MNPDKRPRLVYRVGLALVLLAALGVASPDHVFAQSTTEGAIGGTVSDQTKSVVPGATVTTRNLGTNATASTTSDASGHFTVIRLNPGVYAVEVNLSGFTPFARSGVIVEVGRVTNLDVTISVGGRSKRSASSPKRP
jgi:hypothetical protein